MNNITETLAQFVSSVKYNDLPSTAVQKTKEILLDSIGCALGAYATERAKIALMLSESLGAKPEATIIGYKKAACPSASFVNGELINSLDFDGLSIPGGHVVPYTIPTVLALCEKAGRNGRDFITALATAIEIGGRAVGSLSQLKLLKEEPPYYEEAPRFSYTSVIFGAVAGACKSLELSQEKIRSAFGIGGTSTPVPGGQKWEYLEGPNVNLKYGCWAGWVAMLGAVAAQASEKGFTGDPSILDGEFGYWQMYGSPFFKVDRLIGDLGKVWHIEDVAFKSYPCCYIDHSAIEGVQRLVLENKIQPEEIDEIIAYGDPLMLTPNRWPAEIKTNEDAQFAHTYLLALAAIHTEQPGPQWHLSGTITDPRIQNLMPKVKVLKHPRTPELVAREMKKRGFPVFYDITVEISARGKKFTTDVPIPRGAATRAMPVSENIAKFMQNASYSLVKRDRLEAIIDNIWKLDKLDNIAELTRLLCIED